MSGIIAFCLTCRHCDSMFMFDKEKLRCKKFPNGVPDEVFIKNDCEFWLYPEDEAEDYEDED